jgi:flagellar hook-associated protein 1 FlgK
MGSLTALLSMSQNALEANQAAIDITSNNVANQNTLGYTREVATWQESDSISLSGGTSVSGGASVTAVSQRDRVLDQRVEQQTQAQAATGAESSALDQLQAVFGLSATSTSASSTTLGTDVDAFFNSLSTLQASPSDSSARQGVLSAAATLASDFNSASSQLSAQTNSLNQQAVSVVGQVNSLTASIAALNLQITSTSPTSDAGTLEDQRQQDLTQLSQLVGFNQTQTQDNGISLSTANGAPLVIEGQSFALGTTMSGGNIAVTAANGQDITSGISGGQLGGTIEARDGALATAATALDSLSYAIGGAVNAQNAAGVDANGNPGGAIFTLPSSSVGAAASIAVATRDPNAVAAAAVGEGSSGGTNATALSALAQTALVSGQTASTFFASFLTQVGNAAAGATNSNTVQQASLTQLTTQQSSLSGVSLDDEAANLTQYQRSYEAAAKVFSIVDELLASALNLGEETTVS